MIANLINADHDNLKKVIIHAVNRGGKMGRKIIFINFLCLLLLHFALPKSQAVMFGLSTEDLTTTSDIVIVGEVKDIVSFWNEDSTKIISKAKVIVDEVVRGNHFTEVFVEYEGGEVGGIGMRISDVTPLTIGEQVVLFLKVKKIENGVKIFKIVGDAQGKYTIREDGIAIKKGFSVLKGTESIIDNNIPVKDLLNKIRRIGK